MTQQQSNGHDPRDPRNSAPARPVIEGAPPHNSRHKVRCIAHTWGEASTGTPQLGVLCEVTEGDFKGYTATWYGSITKDASEYTIRGMRALGFAGNDIMQCDSMYQGEALATFEHDRDQDGNPRVRIAWLNGIGVVMKKTYEGAELQRFAQNMRALLAQHGGGGGAPVGSLPPMPAGGQQQQQQGGYTDPYASRGGGQRNAAPPPPWGNDVPPPSEPQGAPPRGGRW